MRKLGFGATTAERLPMVLEDTGGTRQHRQQTARHEEWLSQPAVLDEVRDVLRNELSPSMLDPFAPVGERRSAVIGVLRGAIATGHGALRHLPTNADLLYALYTATLGWGPAQPYLDDPLINEIKIIGTTIVVQEQGQPFVTVDQRFGDETEVVGRVQLLASVLGVTLDGATPQQTLPVAHGTRMHATIPPRVLPNDVLVCIRRGRTRPWDLDDLLQRGTLDQPTADLLAGLCTARCSFLLIGPTGAGKTALLEALINTWPNEPHVVTIEDHTLEIGVRREQTWTREIVDTHLDPDAFGRVAREALRQTPDLLVPGEIRGHEAGAVLALLMSDHPVATTIHARSAAEGVRRFARCAALPRSYMYEGRFPDALEDAAQGFDVLISVEHWAMDGKRVISEISLCAGLHQHDGHTYAHTIPLVTTEVGADGQPIWHAHAQLVDGRLSWNGTDDQTPERLRRRIERARRRGTSSTALPSVALVQTALARAGRQLAAGDGRRALEALRAAWAQRQHSLLLHAAQDALALVPQLGQQALAEGLNQRRALDAAIAERRWSTAADRLATILADLPLAAAAVPDAGWEGYSEQLEAARRAKRVATNARIDAQTAFDQQLYRRTLQVVEKVDTSLLPPALCLELQRLRLAALTQLVGVGDADNDVLAVAQERVAVLERSVEGMEHNQ